MSFSDFIEKIIVKGIKIVDGIRLKKGDSINIYGGPFVGKTTMCFYIIKQNPGKSVVYVNSEGLSPRYLKKLKSITTKNHNEVYMLDCFNIDWLIDMLMQLHFDIVVIDSLTALNYIDNKKKLAELFDIITEKKINMVLVSQIRECKERKYYEHRKLLNFFSYKMHITKNKKEMILDDKIAIKFNEIW